MILILCSHNRLCSSVKYVQSSLTAHMHDVPQRTKAFCMGSHLHVHTQGCTLITIEVT